MTQVYLDHRRKAGGLLSPFGEPETVYHQPDRYCWANSSGRGRRRVHLLAQVFSHAGKRWQHTTVGRQ